MVDFAIPLAGITNAESRASTAAARIARASDPQDTVDLSAEMIALLESKNAQAANVKVAQTFDDINQATLNLLG